MTETQWLASTNPMAMLRHLRTRADARKLRLFACACCRRLAHLDHADEAERILDLAERYADGEIGAADLSEALVGPPAVGHAWAAVTYTGSPQALAAAAGAAAYAAHAAAGVTDPEQDSAWRAALAAERAAQADLLRELFGNPFRPVASDLGMLAQKVDVVRGLAQAIYTERAFERLLLLADALEEAGCRDEEVLAHCRQEGGHVRGCWVVDGLLVTSSPPAP
jgi:hypothetical protein